MSPDKVRAMVSAMQEAGESDDRIRQALDVAKAQEGAAPPAMATVTKTPAPAEDDTPTLGLPRGLSAGRVGAAEAVRDDPNNSFEAAGGRFLQGLAGGASKVMNGVSFGWANRGRRALAKAITGNDDWANAQEAYEAAPFQMPGASGAINRTLGGTAELAGATAALHPVAKGVSGVIEQSVPALTKSIPGRLLTAAGTGSAVGGTDASLRAAAAGEDTKGQLKAGGLGALTGAALSTLTGGIGEAFDFAKGLIRNPKSDLGRLRQDYRSAQNEGRIPKAEALSEGQYGKQEAASNAGREFMDYNDQQLQQARSQYGAELAKLDKEKGNAVVDQDVIHQVLDKLQAENTRSNGTTVDGGLQRAIEATREGFTRRSGIIDPETNQEITRPAGTLSDIVKEKRALSDKAERGGIPTAENRPYRIIEKALGDRLKEIDPDLAAINDRYAQAMTKLETANDKILGADVSAVEPRASKQLRAAGRFGGSGGLETPGGSAESRRQLDEVAALDPKYRDMVRDVRAKQAVEDTRITPADLLKAPLTKARNFLLGHGPESTSTKGIAIKYLDPLLEQLDAARANEPDLSKFGWIPGIDAAVQTARKKRKSPRKSQ